MLMRDPKYTYILYSRYRSHVQTQNKDSHFLFLFSENVVKVTRHEVRPKKIYRLKEGQAFSLSLELGRREKVAWQASVCRVPPSLCRRGVEILQILLLRWKWFKKGWEIIDFVNTLYWKINSCIFIFKNPFTLLFKGIISIDSIFIKFREVTSLHSFVLWCFA